MDFKAHHDRQALGNEIKNIVDECIRDKNTPEQIVKKITELCIDCLMPPKECKENNHKANELHTTLDVPAEYNKIV